MKTLKRAEYFYERYAVDCGFQNRLATAVTRGGEKIWRYVVCNNERFKLDNPTNENNTDKCITKKSERPMQEQAARLMYPFV
ncbi:hypothetical protein OROGR_011893 [Orobanche gracilis]